MFKNRIVYYIDGFSVPHTGEHSFRVEVTAYRLSLPWWRRSVPRSSLGLLTHRTDHKSWYEYRAPAAEANRFYQMYLSSAERWVAERKADDCDPTRVPQSYRKEISGDCTDA